MFSYDCSVMEFNFAVLSYVLSIGDRFRSTTSPRSGCRTATPEVTDSYRIWQYSMVSWLGPSTLK
ncbi:hypothetical protein BTIS_1506 [Bifidobacterium tissieri]|uniref:Uncharacterized protein n=1 Tax=Bifidobacterium tissieri TaxID=1630162 RepID=A0A261FE63_9BIFI|nr:hypothetical protein BTIS_1506 [Bifidobacterium tissieri]